MFEASQEFFGRFCSLFSGDSPKWAEAVSKYTDNTAFTTFITKELNGIIDAMGYIPQNEYFRIDAMGYSSRREELERIHGFYPYLWDLKIAVEHENDAAKWLDEVIKLAHICCPLRVVIGYIPMAQRSRGDAERLAYAASALKRLHCRENMNRGEFMIILGNSNTQEDPQNYFHYKAYVLNKETFSFEELERFFA